MKTLAGAGLQANPLGWWTTAEPHKWADIAPSEGGSDSGDDGRPGHKPKPASAAGVPAGIGAAEAKQVGTQKAAAAHECSDVAGDKGARGSKLGMIAGSRAPAKPSHLINVEFDRTERSGDASSSDSDPWLALITAEGDSGETTTPKIEQAKKRINSDRKRTNQ